MSTRGYGIVAKGNKIEELSYFSSDAYMSWYGLAFLKAAKKGEARAYLANHRKENGEDYEEENTPSNWKMEYFCYHKPKPGEEEGYYPDYAYIFDEKKNTMTVRRFGKVLFRFSLNDEYELYEYIFDNDFDIRYALEIDQETRFASHDGWKELKQLINNGASIQNIQKVISEAPKVFINKGSWRLHAPFAREGDLPTWSYSLEALCPGIEFDGTAFREEPDSDAWTTLGRISLGPYLRGCPHYGYSATIKMAHHNVTMSTPNRSKTGLSRRGAERFFAEIASRSENELVAAAKALRVYKLANNLLKKNERYVAEDENIFRAAKDAINGYLEGTPVIRGIPFLTAKDVIRTLRTEFDTKIARTCE